MSLIYTDIFGKKTDKIQKAIDLLRAFEPENGYSVGFSGGKDSQVLQWVMEQSGCKHKSVYRLTTVDPPELVNFIKTNYPDTIIEKPKETMWQLIERKKTPPTRRVRYCCEVLKERGWKSDDIVCVGVRKDESPRRSQWDQVKHCMKGGGYTLVNPILEFTDKDVWEIIKDIAKIEYCHLYDEGFKRLGCVGCPMASWKQREFEFHKYPKIKRAYMGAFERMLVNRKNSKMKELWTNAEHVWQWWLYGADFKTHSSTNQMNFF